MKKRKKDPGLTSLMLIGAGLALGITVVLAFIMAFISSFTKDPTSLTGALALVSLLVGGAISGFVTSRMNDEGGALVGTLSAVIASALILIIGLIMKSGKLDLSVFINLIAFICVSVLFAILGKKRIKRRRRRH